MLSNQSPTFNEAAAQFLLKHKSRSPKKTPSLNHSFTGTPSKIQPLSPSKQDSKSLEIASLQRQIAELRICAPDLSYLKESLLTQEHISSRLQDHINESKKEHLTLIEYNTSKIAALVSEQEDLYRQEDMLIEEYDKLLHNNSELESLEEEKDNDLHTARIEVEDSFSLRKFEEKDLGETKKIFNRKTTEKFELRGQLEKNQFALRRGNTEL